MKKIILTIVLCLIVFGLGYFYAVKTIEPDIITNTVIELDTTYIETEPVIKWKIAYIDTSKTDTFYVFKTDTFYVGKNLKIASDTTIFDKDTLKAWYFFPPVNRFKYDFIRAPIPIIYQRETITIVKKVKWYKSYYLWGAVGLGLGLYAGGN